MQVVSDVDLIRNTSATSQKTFPQLVVPTQHVNKELTKLEIRWNLLKMFSD